MRPRKARTNTHLVTLNDVEQFFYETAPYSWDPEKETEISGRVKAAIAYAEAERVRKLRGFTVDWEQSPEPWDGDFPYDGPMWVASLWSPTGLHNDPECTGVSLGAIAIDSCAPEHTDDGRVIAAQLMIQYLEGN